MRRWMLAALLPLTLVACGKKEAPQSAAVPPVPVTVMTVAPRTVPIWSEYVGQTQSSRQVQIVARVNGFLEKRLYTEGAPVKAGQVMFQQDPKPFQAQLDAAVAALDEQKARLQVANDNLARVKPLAERQALSQRELDDAIGQQKSAAAAVEVAKANVETARLNLSYTTITTPVAGIASFARVQDGQYVNLADSQLTYVAQMDPIWIEFSLSENDVLQLRQDEKSGRLKLPANNQFVVEAILANGEVFPHKGRITFADADFSQKTGTYLLRATLPNPEGVLRPGMFVTVRISGAVRPNAIVVPQTSVLQGAQGQFVIVVDKDNRAQMRWVTVGQWYGQDWFVDTGLQAGDVVVTDGMAKLSPGALVQITKRVEDDPKAASGTAPLKTDNGAAAKPAAPARAEPAPAAKK
ncbi:MAG: efflux RND transporter periplasmic adaptor subunit [Burkholderiales bacterium]|jgi:membrane fusion protein (multidrug efflux system)|nr:efflux RND transporter periplasmic adaptor subunit [Burkholderiales bacterium]